MSLTDMIVKPRPNTDGDLPRWSVVRGSRSFEVIKGYRGDWEVFNRDDLLGDDYLNAPVLDVSGDLSGALEYIESLFN